MLLYIVVLGLLWILYEISAKPRRDLPGPKPVPFWGNFLEFNKNFQRKNDWVLEYTLKLKGQTWTYCVPTRRFIHISTPANLQHMLKTNFYNYEKGSHFAQCFEELLGKGIFVVDGEPWRYQRKVASHMFKLNALKGFMTKIFQKHGVTLMRILGNVPPDQSIDVQDLFFRYTLESIGEIAYGVSFGCLEKDVPYLKAFDRAQFHANERLFSVGGWKILRALGLFSERQYAKDIKLLNELAYGIVEQRKKLMESELKQREDLLSLFIMEARSKKQTPSNEELRDLVMNFMIAGRDTTAVLLTWTFFCLDQYKDVQQKVLDEMKKHEDVKLSSKTPSSLAQKEKVADISIEPEREELDGEEHESDESYNIVKDMRYLHAVLMEVLRLYPSVPLDGKFAVKDDILPDGTKVYAGEGLEYSPYVSGRLPDLWENPTKFDPERFYNKPEPSAFLFSAFNAGLRLCLGKQMALLEAKILTSTILKEFELRLVPGHKVEMENTITGPMRYGLRMTVHKRSKM